MVKKLFKIIKMSNKLRHPKILIKIKVSKDQQIKILKKSKTVLIK